jgi:hypothetical protein
LTGAGKLARAGELQFPQLAAAEQRDAYGLRPTGGDPLGKGNAVP